MLYILQLAEEVPDSAAVRPGRSGAPPVEASAARCAQAWRMVRAEAAEHRLITPLEMSVLVEGQEHIRS